MIPLPNHPKAANAAAIAALTNARTSHFVNGSVSLTAKPCVIVGFAHQPRRRTTLGINCVNRLTRCMNAVALVNLLMFTIQLRLQQSIASSARVLENCVQQPSWISYRAHWRQHFHFGDHCIPPQDGHPSKAPQSDLRASCTTEYWP